MDEEYDAIVLGTGLKECILSGLLSVDGLKVLHMDRNDYYGGDSASLNLNQVFERFRPGQPVPASLGPNRDYAVDMVPKFIMANGKLIRVLLHTKVVSEERSMVEFKGVQGSYVLNRGRVEKVPASDYEALRSPLMGLFEKRRARKFFIYVQDYEEDNPATHQGLDLKKLSMMDLFKYFSLEPSTIEFIGHALALYTNDAYLMQPALPTVLRVKLYHDSLSRYEGITSPYLYPLYGLGELPQAFARLSAVYGGTYMLRKSDATVVYDDTGKAVGVSAEGQTAKCKFVVGDHHYFPEKVKKTGKVARAICLMNHPIPNTSESHSVQIILPQGQLGRKSDMYIFCCSYEHHVVPKGKYIAFVSTTVETSNPEVELQPGLALLGHIEEKFIEVVDTYEPTTDGGVDKCYISKSYDATSHFESTMDDVLDMYHRITGKKFDLSKKI